MTGTITKDHADEIREAFGDEMAKNVETSDKSNALEVLFADFIEENRRK